MPLIKKTHIILPALFTALAASNSANAIQLQITISNDAGAGGSYLTPVWLGFHDGSFDQFDAGASASAGIEAIAEDGNASVLSASFAGNGVDTVVGGGPIAPGQTVTTTINIADDGSQSYLSFASMLLPSSDFFIGNDDGRAISLRGLVDGTFSSASYSVVTAYDAGTEINDFATSAGNPLFGIAPGQNGPNQGADEFGSIAAITGADFASFLNAEGIDVSRFDFTGASLATITVSTVTDVPVPAAAWLFGSALMGLGTVARKRKQHA